MTPERREALRRAIQPRDPSVMESPVLRSYGRFTVVRDDLLFGGTKMRWVYDVCRASPEIREWGYAGPSWGGASVAISAACFDLGLRSTHFQAWRKERTERQRICSALGARIEQIRPGYLTNVRAKARIDFEGREDARLIKWGAAESRISIEKIAGQVPTDGISEVWCAYGSGTLFDALYNTFKPRGLRVCVVVVGAPISDRNRERADLVVEYPRPFAWRTKAFVPYPSCRHYDAKAWEVASKRARGRALIWNVARDHDLDRDLGGAS